MSDQIIMKPEIEVITMKNKIEVEYSDGSSKVFTSIGYKRNDSSHFGATREILEYNVKIPTGSMARWLYFYIISSDEINSVQIAALPNEYTGRSAFVDFFNGKYIIHAKKDFELDGKYFCYISGNNIIFVKMTKITSGINTLLGK